MLEARDHGEVEEVILMRSLFAWGPFRPFHVRAFRLGPILVDSGPPATGSQLVRFLRPRPPRAVLHTHHHEDHAGGAAFLARDLGLEVYAPAGAVEVLRAPPRISLVRAAVAGRPRPVEARPLPERVEVDGVELEAIPAPGHCDDHTVFLEPRRRWLFSGDLFLGYQVRSVHSGEDVYLTLESLRRAAALEPVRLFCAHAGVVERGAEALRRKIAFWEEVGARIHDLHGQGLGETEIRDRLFGGEHWMAWATRGRFSRLNLVRSFLRNPRPAGQPST